MDDDEYDVYGDLDDFENIKEKTAEIQDLTNRLNASTEQLTKFERDVKQLTSENEILLKNTSSLLKTAKNEISRKDNEIARLRKEMDDICFRRTKLGNKMKMVDKFTQTYDVFVDNGKPAVESRVYKSRGDKCDNEERYSSKGRNNPFDVKKLDSRSSSNSRGRSCSQDRHRRRYDDRRADDRNHSNRNYDNKRYGRDDDKYSGDSRKRGRDSDDGNYRNKKHRLQSSAKLIDGSCDGDNRKKSPDRNERNSSDGSNGSKRNVQMSDHHNRNQRHRSPESKIRRPKHDNSDSQNSVHDLNILKSMDDLQNTLKNLKSKLNEGYDVDILPSSTENRAKNCLLDNGKDGVTISLVSKTNDKPIVAPTIETCEKDTSDSGDKSKQRNEVNSDQSRLVADETRNETEKSAKVIEVINEKPAILQNLLEMAANYVKQNKPISLTELVSAKKPVAAARNDANLSENLQRMSDESNIMQKENFVNEHSSTKFTDSNLISSTISISENPVESNAELIQRGNVANELSSGEITDANIKSEMASPPNSLDSNMERNEECNTIGEDTIPMTPNDPGNSEQIDCASTSNILELAPNTQTLSADGFYFYKGNDLIQYRKRNFKIPRLQEKCPPIKMTTNSQKAGTTSTNADTKDLNKNSDKSAKTTNPAQESLPSVENKSKRVRSPRLKSPESRNEMKLNVSVNQETSGKNKPKRVPAPDLKSTESRNEIKSNISEKQGTSVAFNDLSTISISDNLRKLDETNIIQKENVANELSSTKITDSNIKSELASPPNINSSKMYILSEICTPVESNADLSQRENVEKCSSSEITDANIKNELASPPNSLESNNDRNEESNTIIGDNTIHVTPSDSAKSEPIDCALTSSKLDLSSNKEIASANSFFYYKGNELIEYRKRNFKIPRPQEKCPPITLKTNLDQAGTKSTAFNVDTKDLNTNSDKLAKTSNLLQESVPFVENKSKRVRLYRLKSPETKNEMKTNEQQEICVENKAKIVSAPDLKSTESRNEMKSNISEQQEKSMEMKSITVSSPDLKSPEPRNEMNSNLSEPKEKNKLNTKTVPLPDLNSKKSTIESKNSQPQEAMSAKENRKCTKKSQTKDEPKPISCSVDATKSNEKLLPVESSDDKAIASKENKTIESTAIESINERHTFGEKLNLNCDNSSAKYLNPLNMVESTIKSLMLAEEMAEGKDSSAKATTDEEEAAATAKETKNKKTKKPIKPKKKTGIPPIKLPPKKRKFLNSPMRNNDSTEEYSKGNKANETGAKRDVEPGKTNILAIEEKAKPEIDRKPKEIAKSCVTDEKVPFEDTENVNHSGNQDSSFMDIDEDLKQQTVHNATNESDSIIDLFNALGTPLRGGSIIKPILDNGQSLIDSPNVLETITNNSTNQSPEKRCKTLNRSTDYTVEQVDTNVINIFITRKKKKKVKKSG